MACFTNSFCCVTQNLRSQSGSRFAASTFRPWVRSAIRFGEALASRGTSRRRSSSLPQSAPRPPGAGRRTQSDRPRARCCRPRIYAATWWDVLDVVRELPSDCEAGADRWTQPSHGGSRRSARRARQREVGGQDLRTNFNLQLPTYAARGTGIAGEAMHDLTQLREAPLVVGPPRGKARPSLFPHEECQGGKD